MSHSKQEAACQSITVFLSKGVQMSRACKWREQQEGGVEWVVGKPEQRDSSKSREGKRKGET